MLPKNMPARKMARRLRAQGMVSEDMLSLARQQRSKKDRSLRGRREP